MDDFKKNNFQINNDSTFIPKILVNDLTKKIKVLTTLEEELSKCDEFLFSVAFITESGVTCIVNKLKELESKGIKGTIITSAYLNFTSPKALRKLLSFKNIKLKMVMQEAGDMHTKGYIFKNKDEYSVIIGSSNLTQNALGSNLEWNLKINNKEDDEIIKEVLSEYNRLNEIAFDINEENLTQYEEMYNDFQTINKRVKEDFDLLNPKFSLKKNTIEPNKMQVEALQKIAEVRKNGKKKTLVISATGTGKTFLSAFDVRTFNPKRFLFIVHRETITTAALKTYKKVLGETENMAILSGNSKEYNAKYTFATIQTLSKEEIYKHFKPDTFDYIVIDEVHRAGASTYQKVIDYFKPEFLLGMSATPERSEDPKKIYEMFDYSVAYEIRLSKAMEENLIAPFHYFGVSEIKVNGEILDDKTDFKYLTSDNRVEHIIDTAEFYGYSGSRVKGLIFCSRKEEAKELSTKFNLKGYKTTYLIGDTKQQEREKSMKQLESDDCDNYLDYIFTVDIFNEGIDIPAVNQVIMLRPTDSAIVFVQQLGRGLRKFEDKEYVNVIDFIGNYNTNFLIPIALSGDNSYNKDNLRRYLFEGSSVIPGCSTINFEPIVKDMIFKNIDQTNLNDLKFIKESYNNLKVRLGRIPTLMEFEEYNAIDVLKIFEKCGSYHEFLEKNDADYNIELNDSEKLYINFISTKLSDGKRPHELVLIDMLLKNDVIDLKPLYKQRMLSDFNINLCNNSLIVTKNILTGDYLTGSGKKKYLDISFIDATTDAFIISDEFKQMINKEYLKSMVNELIEFSLHRNKLTYNDRYLKTNFVLYKKYTYEDVCKLLNWHKSEVALNIGGYKYDEDTNTFPVFINYDKCKNINETINYHDRFTSRNELIAMSKTGSTMATPAMKVIKNQNTNNVQIHLFVRKNKDDKTSKEFYYLGQLSTQKLIMETLVGKNIVEITYQLDTPLEEGLYKYIIS